MIEFFNVTCDKKSFVFLKLAIFSYTEWPTFKRKFVYTNALNDTHIFGVKYVNLLK